MMRIVNVNIELLILEKYYCRDIMNKEIWIPIWNQIVPQITTSINI